MKTKTLGDSLKEISLDFLKGIWTGMGKPPSETPRKPRSKRVVGIGRKR